VLTQQNKEFRHGLIIDEEFLTNLNARLQTITSSMLDDLAQSEGISRDELDELIAADQEKIEWSQRDIARKALSNSKIKYSVKWKGGVGAENISFNELIEILGFESARPTRLEAEIGDYGSSRTSMVIEPYLTYTGNITVKADHTRLAHIMDSLFKLLEKSQPEFPWLHSIYFYLIFITFQMILYVAYFSYQDYINGRQITAFDLLLNLFVSSGIANIITRIYVWAFPTIEFRFGSYKAIGSARKLLIGFMSVVLIPALMTYWFAVHPIVPTAPKKGGESSKSEASLQNVQQAKSTRQ
jgi:hypothetical protein